MRAVVARLERHEAMLPLEDVVVSIDESLVRDLIGAQLPFEMDVGRFHLSLTRAEVRFRGSPSVGLQGTIHPTERPGVEASLGVLGALEGIEVNRASSSLRARIAVDHVEIEKAAGIESIVSGATLDEVARSIRLRISEQLPPVQIPVQVQQKIDLPAVTHGPVRIDGARMDLKVAVSQVLAGRGQLWIAVHLEPGEAVKTAVAPPAGETKASDVGVSLVAEGSPSTKQKAPK